MKVTTIFFRDGKTESFLAPLGIKEKERTFVVKTPDAVHLIPFENVLMASEAEKPEGKA